MTRQGFNFRMTNLQAAIGCAQLARMDEFLAMRRKVAALYETALAGIPGITFPSAMPSARSLPWCGLPVR